MLDIVTNRHHLDPMNSESVETGDKMLMALMTRRVILNSASIDLINATRKANIDESSALSTQILRSGVDMEEFRMHYCIEHNTSEFRDGCSKT